MSKIYKCDRCGAEICMNLDDHALFIGRYPFINCHYDLCPMCQKELENWFACPDYNYNQVCGKKSKEEEK